ncbi:MAG: Ig-like domain-containing protein, partial [Anaerolineae bacterium]
MKHRESLVLLVVLLALPLALPYIPAAETPFPIVEARGPSHTARDVTAPDPGAPLLLLTEVVVTPTEGEFVEIHNPSDVVVDLSDVYLTDATYAGGGTYYYNIVTGSNAGGGGFGDFHARFPDGATIDPDEYQTVALAGSDAFSTTYGVAPTYELYEDGVTADGVPDLREAVAGSINDQGGLSNAGEVAILYYWDGQTDLVTDLDYVLWGDKNEAVDKTGVSIDGPDADGDASSYLADTAVGTQDIVGTGDAPHAYGSSAQRGDLTEGAEAKSGGNGADGHDETSEDLSNTWQVEAPTPNSGLTWLLLLTEVVVTPTEGEFVEIHNPSDVVVDLSDVYLTDATYAGGGTYYYNIVTGSNAGGGGFGDFHARFPDGATIDPDEYQTVALAGSDAFSTTYGVAPTYELYEDGVTADGVPDLREAVAGSINDQGGLSNAGEVAILYYWDGQTDLVTDLDYVLWGDKNEAVDKTGVSIDGPDADGDASSYLADTAVGTQDIVGTGDAPHAYGSSAQRGDLTEGAETKSGGNGADGHDETSEDLSNTWREDDPTPGAGAAGPSGAPVIIATQPVSDAVGVNPYLPVKVTFDVELDSATVNDSNLTLETASGPISGRVYYDADRLAAVFDSVGALAANTVHTATVSAAVASETGTPMGSDYVWRFTTGSVTLGAYHGSIHNHTSYSDGTSDPNTAFTRGRERGLDFMAVSDHSYSISDAEWEDTLAQAVSHTVDGTYVALRGCEFTQGTEGHANVYNTVRHPVRNDTGADYADYTPTLSDFYDWMAEHPE